MAEIIGVRFKEGGKIYYFCPNEETLETGCHVIVETVRGVECGEVVMDRREIDDSEFNREVKTIIRKATDADLVRLKENKIRAAKAFDICNQKIKAHGLEMNLLEVECTFDNSKMVFSFSAEGRVDFRELVKDLASVFHARIELRQIGVRDEAKMLGGLGVCGRPFCCKQFMGDFQSVSIKMAKEQGLSLNPVKISGTCGRLMCCLKHEQDAYEELMLTMPQIGSPIITPDGPGTVVDRELIAGRVKVRIDGLSEAPPKTFRMSEVYKPGEAPPRPSAEKRFPVQPAGSRRKPAAETAESVGRKKAASETAAPSGRKISAQEPVEQVGKKKPAPEPVEQVGKKKPAPEPVEQAGRKKPAPEPNESAGRKKPAPELTESIKKKKPAPPSAESGTSKKKPAIDYKSLDFEESLSGKATKVNPDDYEEELPPVRGANRSRGGSRRSGKRPDRRYQGAKGNNGGKPPFRDNRQGGEGKSGNQGQPHGKNKSHQNNKNGGSQGGQSPE